MSLSVTIASMSAHLEQYIPRSESAKILREAGSFQASGEKSLAMQDAQKRALMNIVVVRELGVFPMLSKFNGDILQSRGSFEPINQQFYHFKQEEGFASELDRVDVMQGYALNWESEMLWGYSEGQQKPLNYRLVAAALDAKTFGWNIESSFDKNELTNKKGYDAIQDSQVQSFYIDSVNHSQEKIRVPLLTHSLEFMPQRKQLDKLRHITELQLLNEAATHQFFK